MKLTINPIHKLIAEGEHVQQDFKFCINDSRKIAKTLVAFANTRGGRLLVGVKDNGNIAGVRSEEEIYMVQAAARLYSRPEIELFTQEWDVDGKKVLEVVVQPGTSRPYLAEGDDRKWIAYIRKDDENFLANPVLIKSWKLEQQPRGLLFEYEGARKVLIDTLHRNGTITLSKLAREAQIQRSQAEQILAEMVFLKCIVGHFDNVPVHYTINEDFDFEEFV